MNTLLGSVMKARAISIHHPNMKIIPYPVYPSCIDYLPIIHSAAV